MSPAPNSIKELPVVQKVGNRRRRGYELTRQRNMLPIALGAATAAVLIHVLAYLFFPETFRLGLARYLVPPRVDEAEMRVVVREAPEEEIQADVPEELQEPQEIDEIPYEQEEIDILDAQIEELEIAPGETQATVDIPSPLEAEDAEAEPAAPCPDGYAGHCHAAAGDGIPFPQRACPRQRQYHHREARCRCGCRHRRAGGRPAEERCGQG